MSKLVELVNETYAKKEVANYPDFRTGDTLAVHCRITEGAKSRIQIYQGMCISIKAKGQVQGHFRVRKTSAGGYGVERVFPFHSPNVEKIEVVQRGKSRRSKLYYLRDRSGKSARIAIDYDRK